MDGNLPRRGRRRSLDDDGGGSLTTLEIKAALKQFHDAKIADDKRIMVLKKSEKKMKDAARKAQEDWDEIIRVDEEQAAAAVERAKQEAEAKANAAEAARLEKERQEAEKAAAAAAEKAEFEAKIKARRKKFETRAATSTLHL